jgi:hypothetical protein
MAVVDMHRRLMVDEKETCKSCFDYVEAKLGKWGLTKRILCDTKVALYTRLRTQTPAQLPECYSHDN